MIFIVNIAKGSCTVNQANDVKTEDDIKAPGLSDGVSILIREKFSAIVH